MDNNATIRIDQYTCDNDTIIPFFYRENHITSQINVLRRWMNRQNKLLK